MITARHAGGAGRRGPASARDDADDNGDSDFFDLSLKNVYRWLLDNETLGAAVRAAITVEDSENGRKTFGLFGLGHFSIDASDDGGISLAESATGFTVPLRTNGVLSEGDARDRQEERQAKLTMRAVLIRVLSLLDPAEWLFVAILLGAIGLPVGVIRIAMRSDKRGPIRSG